MYELIGLIGKILVKGLNLEDLSQIYDKKKLREIGARLFLFYVHLSDIVVDGEKIMRHLEEYVEDRNSYHSRAVMSNVVEQRISLEKLEREIRQLAIHLQVLDAKSYRELDSLIFEKRNILNTLLELMHLGFPLLSSSDIRTLTGEYRDTRGRRIRRRAAIREVEARILSTSWDENTSGQIEKYLEEGKPWKNLEEIRGVLEQLRIALESNFSIDDILLGISETH